MLLMSSGKVSSLIAAARETIRDENVLLPTITKMPNKAKTVGADHFKSGDHVREALESKAGMPTDMNVMRYCNMSAPSKSIRYGSLPVDEGEESLLLEIEQAAEPGVYEEQLSDQEKNILEGLRSEIKMFKPDKAYILSQLRELVHLQREDCLDQETEVKDLKKQLETTVNHATEMKRELDQLISQLESKLQSKEQELAEAAAKEQELTLQVQSLEEQFKLANSAGITAEEAAKTVVQLAKSRATVEALKQQVDELQAKAQEAESARRAELQAMRDKQRKAQEELHAVMDQYGPENFAKLSAQLQDTLAELGAAQDRLRRAKLAQEQQHRLVVEWRIRVDEADVRVREAAAAAEGREAEIARLGQRVTDLEAQVAMREVDVRKLRDQAEALTARLQDYVDKYSRQAAHLKAQEAVWKAIAVRNAELELAAT